MFFLIDTFFFIFLKKKTFIFVSISQAIHISGILFSRFLSQWTGVCISRPSLFRQTMAKSLQKAMASFLRMWMGMEVQQEMEMADEEPLWQVNKRKWASM